LAGALGYGRFAVSQTGVLAYRTGASVPTSQMVWLSRKGQKLGTIGQPDTYEDPVLSPDGTQLAVEVGEPGKRDIWVYDLKRGTASRLTFNPADDVNPVWSADGRRIFFSSTRRGHRDLYAKSANGLGNTQPVFVSRHQTMSLHDLSPDGRYAIYGAMGEGGLWILPLFGEGKPFVFVQNRFDPHSARFSPSDRYVAYTSAETGKDEVYVQTFPRHTGKWQVSKNGGSEPMWRGDGRELFYISPDKGAMAVEVNTNAAHFRAGTPKLLFKAQLGQNLLWRNRYVVSPDGQRFLMLVPAGQEKLSPITVVLNWPALLKKQ
jgi:dipeptidyl aminopeptidase/acylaminoacyl peptidase